ncbi:hypothetical protein P4O66_002720 [Electrophorus voltai]|uniref:Uncharacterized protein n=1 Tax=Electrophorus voltai TaxID=2609070 RepID=A0AAD9DLU8_9TELE|nr:hypothetical protein P4O66_002720 [Electrophorus voltai]
METAPPAPLQLCMLRSEQVANGVDESLSTPSGGDTVHRVLWVTLLKSPVYVFVTGICIRMGLKCGGERRVRRQQVDLPVPPSQEEGDKDQTPGPHENMEGFMRLLSHFPTGLVAVTTQQQAQQYESEKRHVA